MWGDQHLAILVCLVCCQTDVVMNLLLNILFIYFLPIIIYTIGKNEYAENADEHLLSQRTIIDESNVTIFSTIVLMISYWRLFKYHCRDWAAKRIVGLFLRFDSWKRIKRSIKTLFPQNIYQCQCRHWSHRKSREIYVCSFWNRI